MTDERRLRVFIGIPAYSSVPGETLEDYMRFAYHIGRRNTEFDFFLGIKTKSEQFRARNSIVEAALEVGADYLLMLDDDHVIEWRNSSVPSDAYDIAKRLIAHKKDIVGALYYHRGGSCLPVLMKEGKDGGFYYLRDDEITGGLQEVAVQGGGCMLIDMNVFSRIPSPWFEPEFQFGTDVQICKKAREQGYSVWCDTSIILGHVLSRREVVTPENRLRIMSESPGTTTTGGVDHSALTHNALALYRMDAEEYTRIPIEQMETLAQEYIKKYAGFSEHENPDEYYRSLGKEQIARQVMFHHQPAMVEQASIFLKMVDTNVAGYGLDFGCGSAPIGFELAMRGHRMDFVDLDGTPAYEFTKWRVAKRGLINRCGFEWGGPYDYILAMDSIEHIKDWKPLIDRMVDSLKPEGFLLTNFMLNKDYANVEHVNMDKKGFMEYVVSKGLFPVNQVLFIKRNLGFMDKPKQ